MRVATVSQMKGWRAPSSEMPAEGSAARAIAEFLLEHRGAWVSLKGLSRRKNRSSALRALIDHYGFDIDSVGPPSCRMHRLRGEFFGFDYVSYLNEPGASQ